MNGYQIVNESVNITENAALVGLAALGGSYGLWYLNRNIRTNKVLAMYPTPSALKAKLMAHPNASVRAVAEELTDDMNPQQYKLWVAKKSNPKMGVGKAILLWIFAYPNLLVQTGKAVVHGTEDADTILNRAIDKQRIYN